MMEKIKHRDGCNIYDGAGAGVGEGLAQILIKTYSTFYLHIYVLSSIYEESNLGTVYFPLDVSSLKPRDTKWLVRP